MAAAVSGKARPSEPVTSADALESTSSGRLAASIAVSAKLSLGPPKPTNSRSPLASDITSTLRVGRSTRCTPCTSTPAPAPRRARRVGARALGAARAPGAARRGARTLEQADHLVAQLVAPERAQECDVHAQLAQRGRHIGRRSAREGRPAGGGAGQPAAAAAAGAATVPSAGAPAGDLLPRHALLLGQAVCGAPGERVRAPPTARAPPISTPRRRAHQKAPRPGTRPCRRRRRRWRRSPPGRGAARGPAAAAGAAGGQRLRAPHTARCATPGIPGTCCPAPPVPASASSSGAQAGALGRVPDDGWATFKPISPLACPGTFACGEPGPTAGHRAAVVPFPRARAPAGWPQVQTEDPSRPPAGSPLSRSLARRLRQRMNVRRLPASAGPAAGRPGRCPGRQCRALSAVGAIPTAAGHVNVTTVCSSLLRSPRSPRRGSARCGAAYERGRTLRRRQQACSGRAPTRRAAAPAGAAERRGAGGAPARHRVPARGRGRAAGIKVRRPAVAPRPGSCSPAAGPAAAWLARAARAAPRAPWKYPGPSPDAPAGGAGCARGRPSAASRAWARCSW